MNLKAEVRRTLSPRKIALLKKIGNLALSCGCRAFLVGGSVRDILTGVNSPDIDIAIEGDAINIGRILSKQLEASLTVHNRFGTCSLKSADGLNIDLITARKERYPKPASLPVVEFSSLKDDLARRDFTINAMAMIIFEPAFGALIDPFGAVADLKNGIIRVLHDRSFIDDPTRILRAVRFEARFGFRTDSHTDKLMRSAVKSLALNTLSRERLRDQLILALNEKDPVKVVKRMGRLDRMRFINKDIKFNKDSIKLCEAADKVCARLGPFLRERPAPEKWIVFLAAIFEHLTYSQVSAICREFAFNGIDARRLLSCKKSADAAVYSLGSGKYMAASMIYRLLKPLSIETIAFILAKAIAKGPKSRADRARSRVEGFLRDLDPARASISASDLKLLGLKDGPEFKSILDSALYGKMDGKLKTRRQELMYARSRIGRMLKTNMERV